MERQPDGQQNAPLRHRIIQMENAGQSRERRVEKVEILEKEKHRTRRKNTQRQINLLLAPVFGPFDQNAGKVIHNDEKKTISEYNVGQRPCKNSNWPPTDESVLSLWGMAK